MKTLRILLLLACVVEGVNAQEPPAKPVPPPGPLIQKRAPDFSRWTVSAKAAIGSQGQDSSQDSSQDFSQKDNSKNIITTTTITKTGDIIRVEYTDELKRLWNIWLQAGQQVVAWPDGKSLAFPAKPPPGSMIVNPLYRDFTNGDFQGFDWISATNYTGIKQVAGRNCLVFQDKINTNGLSSSVSAATDLKTRLPVQLVNAGIITSYEFLPPPAALQTLPEKVQKLIMDQKRREQSLAPRPGPAF